MLPEERENQQSKIKLGKSPPPMPGNAPAGGPNLWDHLAGKQTIGVYPLLPGDLCWFLVIDFDGTEWVDDVFKKLATNDELWEVRVVQGNNIFRFLCFFDGDNLIVVTKGFQKKTPKQEIALAEKRKKGYLVRKNNG